MKTIKLYFGPKGSRLASRQVIELKEGSKVMNTRPLRMKAFGNAREVRVKAGSVGTVARISGNFAYIRFSGPETFCTDFNRKHATLFTFPKEA